MKIVIIGASGTVGRAVTETLSRKHEVIRVGRTQGITRSISPRRRVSRHCSKKSVG